MRNFNNWLKSVFLSSMNSQPYLVQLKANALLYFNLFFIILMIMLSAALQFVPVNSANHFIAYIIIILTVITCLMNLVLLKNGKYNIAANILGSILIIFSIAGFLNKIRLNPHTGYTSYVYLMFSVLIFTGMFCTRKLLLSALFLFITSVIFFHNVVSYKEGFHDENLAVASIVLSVFSLLAAAILTYLFVRIGEKAVLKAEYFADELRNLADSLEKKVELRTEELHSAMEEMEAMNAQLVKTSDALWGEMELARKIQTVLLPESPLISGYEISAYMNPASKIGGDYYDIINAEGYDWIVIGDVSGHGIPAGLVMMMVQTAVRAVLEQNPGQSPSELLKHINRSVSNNIQLLDEDKYMTITVFLAIENGEFIFSGLHQDILIHRADTGKIDVVETTGSWIGLLGEVKGENRDAKIKLDIGDTMLVYTDGIIEAWEKGSEIDNRTLKQMFGEEKLINIFSEYGSRPTNDIKRLIIEKLMDYDCHDDVTMVILKRTA